MGLSQKGQYDQAISHYTRALKINPRYAAAYLNRGVAYGKKGQYDQTITDYTMALKIDPRYAEAYSNRGVAYGRKGQYDQGIIDYNRGLEINPRLAGVYNNRAVAFYFKKAYDQAWKDIRKAQSLGYKVDPGFSKTFVRLRGGKNELTSAKKGKGTAMRKFAFILVLIAALLASGQSWAAEVGTAQYYLEQGNKEHFKGGNLDQAIAEYTRALEIDPGLLRPTTTGGLTPMEKKASLTRPSNDYNRALKINPRLAGPTTTGALPMT